ncbi:hypothetical protein ABZ741_39430, partial [Streptomyces globisporus]|uniref:hypothetical protein n=1 Tax=Streptomyces globisporus TaxID=1908 RepID=UPI0034610274
SHSSWWSRFGGAAWMAAGCAGAAAMAGTGFAQFMPSSASAAMSRGGFSDQWVVGWPGLISLVWVAMVFRVELSPLGGGGPGLSSLS